MDEGSRTSASLARSLAMTLNSVGHPKLVKSFDAFLVLSPEHWRIFKEGGWDKARIKDELIAATARPGRIWCAGRAASRPECGRSSSRIR